MFFLIIKNTRKKYLYLIFQFKKRNVSNNNNYNWINFYIPD